MHIGGNFAESGPKNFERFSFFSALIGTNFYFLKQEKLELYVSPLLGISKFGKVGLLANADPSINFGNNSQFSYGLEAGSNFRISNSLFFVVNVSIIKMDLKLEEPITDEVTQVKSNPILMNLGFAYQF